MFDPPRIPTASSTQESRRQQTSLNNPSRYPQQQRACISILWANKHPGAPKKAVSFFSPSTHKKSRTWRSASTRSVDSRPPLAPPPSHIFHILAYSPHIGARRHMISEASESKGPQQPPSSRPARLVMGRTPLLQVLPPGAESPSFFCSIPALSQPPASKAGLHTWAVAWQISDHSHPVSDHHVTTYTCTLRAATSGRVPLESAMSKMRGGPGQTHRVRGRRRGRCSLLQAPKVDETPNKSPMPRSEVQGGGRPPACELPVDGSGADAWAQS